MKKRLLALFLVLVLSVLSLPVSLAADVDDAGVFLKQQTRSTCTLASATMMLRRRAILDADAGWQDITESSVKRAAWSGGLAWNFSYHGLSVSVMRGASGWAGSSLESKRAALIELLAAHPEGVVAYSTSQPHAVLLTDYDPDTGVFYCCDPAPYYPAGRVELVRSSIKGGDQDAVLKKINQLWYISGGVSSGAGTDEEALAEQEVPLAGAPLAREATQEVSIDGQTVQLRMYALTDEEGNDVNYVKLRDMAQALNGTQAQFDVGYDGAVTLTTHSAYQASEQDAEPVFVGDQPYVVPAADTLVDGVAAQPDAIQLTDEQGGGHIYYNLRDLGQLLGYQVGWDPDAGICVETSPWTFTTLCRLVKSQSVFVSPSSLLGEVRL